MVQSLVFLFHTSGSLLKPYLHWQRLRERWRQRQRHEKELAMATLGDEPPWWLMTGKASSRQV